MYYPKIIALIACLSPRLLQQTRQSLAQSLDGLMVDDKSLYYGNELRNGLEAASDILSCQNMHIDMGEALESVVFLMTSEDRDAEKHVFVLIDEFKDEARSLRQIERIFYLDRHENTHCIFHILDMGNDKPKMRALCDAKGIEYVPVNEPALICHLIRERY